MTTTDPDEDARTPEERTLTIRRLTAVTLAQLLPAEVEIAYLRLEDGVTPEEALERSLLLRRVGDQDFLRSEELGTLSVSQATERVLERHRAWVARLGLGDLPEVQALRWDVD